jgi:RHS repeat-associated protein
MLTDYQYTGQRNETEIGLYYYVARFYDPQLGRFISADTIVPEPGNVKAYDRYSYVTNNPINFNDPSGKVLCDSQDNCTPSKIWSIDQLKAFALNLFTWKVSGDVSRNQIMNIIKAGNLIKSHIDQSTSNQGVNWIRANLGSTTFARNDKTVSWAGNLGASAYVWPYNTVNLGASDVFANDIIHELGHVLDNNNTPSLIPATVFGGGPADNMVRAMGGHPGLNPLRMQFGDIHVSSAKINGWIPWFDVDIVPNYRKYAQNVAGTDPWESGDYANNGVSDDFAQTFRYTITGEKTKSYGRIHWMEAYLIP